VTASLVRPYGLIDDADQPVVSTTVHGIRSIDVGAARETSTTLAGVSRPPVWLGDVLNEVRRLDKDSALNPVTVRRMVQALIQLPKRSAKPEVGVGDDGSVGLEWDFDDAHVEIYLSNDDDDDAFIVDTDAEDDVIEVPLFSALPKVIKFFEILAR